MPGPKVTFVQERGDLAGGVTVQQTIHLGNDLGWGGPGLPGKLWSAHAKCLGRATTAPEVKRNLIAVEKSYVFNQTDRSAGAMNRTSPETVSLKGTVRGDRDHENPPSVSKCKFFGNGYPGRQRYK